jgi:predicted RNA binding protein YcfA (HicA-like mRNA interferase family)
MKTSELTRLLAQNGCRCTGHGTRHDEWYSPINGKTFWVPRHGAKEIPQGTARKILKDAGLK